MLEGVNHMGRRVLVKYVIIYLKVALLQQKHVWKVDPLSVFQREFFTFWGVKFLMTLPMLERLKQSSVSGLVTMEVNTDLLKK